jgi:hypothetical protein
LNWLQAHIDATDWAAYNMALMASMASMDEWLENPSTQTQVQLPRTRSTRRHSALSLLPRKQPEVFRATRVRLVNHMRLVAPQPPNRIGGHPQGWGSFEEHQCGG